MAKKSSTDNLVSLGKRTAAERTEIARKGAYAAAETKRHKIALRAIINQLLYRPNEKLPTDTPGITPIEQVIITQMQKAIGGDTQAAALILKYVDKWYINQEHKDFENENGILPFDAGNYSGLFEADEEEAELTATTKPVKKNTDSKMDTEALTDYALQALAKQANSKQAAATALLKYQQEAKETEPVTPPTIIKRFVKAKSNATN